MKRLPSQPRKDVIDWLLEDDNPSVRYLTLTTLLDKTLANPEVKRTKQAIMTQGIVPKILDKQHPDGYWADPDKFYRNKYKGTSWQLLILAQLGADPQDARIKKACEFILQHSQDEISGGFSTDHSKTANSGMHSWVIPCLTGNMVFSLIRLGYINDARLKRAIDWITTYQRFDDGNREKLSGWPYDRFKMCFGQHTCHMGAVKALKALAEIPEKQRSRAVKRTIDQAAEYILIHHIYKRSHDLSRISRPGWLRLGFPRMYQTDILEILGILFDLGVQDERMQAAVDKLNSKQTKEGRWILEDTTTGRSVASIEQKGKPSKWITLRALRVLKRYYNGI